jgi:hypothetical protein
MREIVEGILAVIMKESNEKGLTMQIQFFRKIQKKRILWQGRGQALCLIPGGPDPWRRNNSLNKQF